MGAHPSVDLFDQSGLIDDAGYDAQVVNILHFYTWSIRCFVHAPQNTSPAKRTCGMWVVIGLLGGPSFGLLREVLATHAFHLWGGGHVDRRFSSLLRTREERSHQPQKEAERTAGATPQVRYHNAGMDAIDAYTGPLQPPGQLVGEKDHG